MVEYMVQAKCVYYVFKNKQTGTCSDTKLFNFSAYPGDHVELE
jgi:hypothetical protein